MPGTERTLPTPAMPATVFGYNHTITKAAQHPYRTFFGKVVAPKFWLFYYLFAAILGSQIAFLVNPLLGVYATFAALAICIGIAIRHAEARTLAVSTALIPLALIITLCLPQGSHFAGMVVFYDALLILAMVYRYIFAVSQPAPQPTADTLPLGFVGYVKAMPTMIILGQGLGILAYVALKDQYQYADASFGMVVACAAIFAIAEESLFRGLVQKQGGTILHPVMAAVLSTLLYACLAIGQGNWITSAVALVTGGVLSTVYYYRPNVMLTVLLNFTAKLVYLLLLANLAWGYFRF